MKIKLLFFYFAIVAVLAFFTVQVRVSNLGISYLIALKDKQHTLLVVERQNVYEQYSQNTSYLHLIELARELGLDFVKDNFYYYR